MVRCGRMTEKGNGLMNVAKIVGWLLVLALFHGCLKVVYGQGACQLLEER